MYPWRDPFHQDNAVVGAVVRVAAQREHLTSAVDKGKAGAGQRAAAGVELEDAQIASTLRFRR